MKTPQSSLLAANLICSASMLIWAAGLPAADHLIPLLPPEQLTALRMALTAAALSSERDEALAAGMNEFLTKPIDAPRLRASLVRLIGHRDNDATRS